MSETKFTPGPWQTFGAHPVQFDEISVSFVVQYDKPINRWPIKVSFRNEDDLLVMRHFAEAYRCGDMSDEELQANARLIAAAPDLYAELDRARAWFQARLDGEAIGGSTRERLDAATAALSRARGEAP